MNKRIFVTKKPQFMVESTSIYQDILQTTHIDTNSVTLYNIYDLFQTSEAEVAVLKGDVLAEINTDLVLDEVEPVTTYLAYEPNDGQYDQRSDSAQQCLRLIQPSATTQIKSGRMLVFGRNLTQDELAKIQAYLINPLEYQIKHMDILSDAIDLTIDPVPVVENFRQMSEAELVSYCNAHALAMHVDDLRHIQTYFKTQEQRDPLYSEIKVLDTYWSDHCRHTTFETILETIELEPGVLQAKMEAALATYFTMRKECNRSEKKVSLMDMACIGARYLKAKNVLTHVEESDEINACSVEFDIEVDGNQERWLVMYKNETHNHPTEIEPFGGASTCIGGAIRDPLSGRAYVYQAMRITGAGDITQPLEARLENKLAQRQISKGAAAGYSSYGNQIGLATTFVRELFDPGYVAKRMEVGAVVGAVKKAHVRREACSNNDWIVLIGGPTGRDGIGGATGSSVEHDQDSLHKCGSQVQKGNAIIERKIQRLFRNPACTTLIKKSNDFGAGGVSVAIGELADGLDVNLDAVDVKYAGLNGMEIAISESQERMAVVIEAKDFEALAELCEAENLVARHVGVVTDTNRLVMHYQGQTIVDLDRKFINTNGVEQRQDVVVATQVHADPFASVYETLPLEQAGVEVLADLNVASQQGMVELFDASIGRSTVLSPYGGKYRLSESMASVQTLPVDGNSDACSILSYGFVPMIANSNPYLGSSYGVIEALARQLSVGSNLDGLTISCQEYFERLKTDPKKWGTVTAAMLGLVEAQMAFQVGAIGGKDSMSGTYQSLHVPPTLITFALNVKTTKEIIVNHFQSAGQYIYLVKHTPNADFTPNYEMLRDNFASITAWNQTGLVASSAIVSMGGLFATLAKMSFGNMIGAEIQYDGAMFAHSIGDIVVVSETPLQHPNAICLGKTVATPCLTINQTSFDLAELVRANQATLAPLYPLAAPCHQDRLTAEQTATTSWEKSHVQITRPRVLIPVFPGTNCEYDSARAFRAAGAEVEIFPLNNQSEANIAKSIASFAQKLEQSQILMLAGGFSGGDEPDGSGKFIVSVLKNPSVAKAIETMRANDGLILGICNGFQALIKSGLLPYGRLGDVASDAPTLFRNDINRHVAKLAYTKIIQNKCVFTKGIAVGTTHLIPFSHGEGKFVASEAQVADLLANGQVVSAYCDEAGVVSNDGAHNINGSSFGIEGICSPDGRIFGKMGHSERYETGLFKNVEGNLKQEIFENAVAFFSWKEGK
ncbi:MAG: phosphoribosylformylglycinamidine synthase [Erysipelotrichaceae bacterium]